MCRHPFRHLSVCATGFSHTSPMCRRFLHTNPMCRRVPNTRRHTILSNKTSFPTPSRARTLRRLYEHLSIHPSTASFCHRITASNHGCCLFLFPRQFVFIVICFHFPPCYILIFYFSYSSFPYLPLSVPTHARYIFRFLVIYILASYPSRGSILFF